MTDSLLWDAWEQWDELGDCYVLYVMGEVDVKKERNKMLLIKKHLPGLPESNLLLEVISCTNQKGKKRQELVYAEKICSKKRYSCITVFSGHRVIAEITELEKAEGIQEL
jgi:hypothetical protein